MQCACCWSPGTPIITTPAPPTIVRSPLPQPTSPPHSPSTPAHRPEGRERRGAHREHRPGTAHRQAGQAQSAPLPDPARSSGITTPPWLHTLATRYRSFIDQKKKKWYLCWAYPALLVGSRLFFIGALRIFWIFYFFCCQRQDTRYVYCL
jgi:hypothetical protein